MNGKVVGIYIFVLGRDSFFVCVYIIIGIENFFYLMIDIVVCMFYVVSELVFGGVDSSGYIYSYKIGLEGGFIYFNW